MVDQLDVRSFYPILGHLCGRALSATLGLVGKPCRQLRESYDQAYHDKHTYHKWQYAHEYVIDGARLGQGAFVLRKFSVGVPPRALEHVERHPLGRADLGVCRPRAW